jgi:hypothetical protein
MEIGYYKGSNSTGEEINVTITARDDVLDPAKLELDVSINKDATTYNYSVVLDTQNLQTSSFSIQAQTQFTMDDKTLCLLKVVIFDLVRPVIECYSPNIDQFLRNLKSKGIYIAAKIVAGAIECFM